MVIVGFNHHKKSSDFSLIPWVGTKYLSYSQRAWIAIPKEISKQQAINDIEQLPTMRDYISKEDAVLIEVHKSIIQQ